MLAGANLRYELAEEAGRTADEGLAAMDAFAKKLSLPDRIDNSLHRFKKHLPDHESDHVLNLAYNGLCSGTCLQDIETRRNDEFFLDSIGAERLGSNSTTTGFSHW